MANFYQDTGTIAQIRAADVCQQLRFHILFSVLNPWAKEAPTSDSHPQPLTPPHVLLPRPDREEALALGGEPATNPRLFTARVD